MRQRRRALLAAVLAVAFAAAVVAAEEDDLYETLGVPRDATKRTIKKEYYRLAKTWHPDKHPGDAKVEARFKKISRAYEVLFDDEQRRKYDQFGHEGLRNDGGGGGGGGPFHFHSSGGGQGFRMQFDDDIFSGFFGNDGGFGRGFGGGFGGGGFHHEEQPRQRVCHYNKICAARGCSLQKECSSG